MRFPLLTACTLVALATPVQADGMTSVYTRLDFENGCERVGQIDEGDSASLLCRGYREYPVHVAEDDLRQAVQFGFKATVIRCAQTVPSDEVLGEKQVAHLGNDGGEQDADSALLNDP